MGRAAVFGVSLRRENYNGIRLALNLGIENHLPLMTRSGGSMSSPLTNRSYTSIAYRSEGLL